ncbi:MAG: hypothetical protein ACK5DG_01275 [Chitinophagaceae bacterium]|jgi:hypothetical protein
MEQNKQSADEISIGSIKDSLLSFSLALYHLFQSFFDFVKGHIKTIALPVIILGMLGGALAFMLPKVYNLKMTVIPTELSRKMYSDQFLQLDKLVKTKSYSRLTKELGLSEAILKKITQIKCSDLYDEPLINDTTIYDRDPFVVYAKVIDNTIADTLQQALMNYINNNPYLVSIKKIQERIYTEKLLFVESEQRKLDSLKIVYNNSLATSGNKAMFYNNAFNPAELYSKSTEYQSQKDFIYTWMGENKYPLRIVDGFKPAQKADSLSKTFTILLSLIAGFVIGVLIAAYKELGRMSKQLAA